MSVTHDVPITNLLVDGGVVDEGALHLRGRLIGHWLRHVLHLADEASMGVGVHGHFSFLALSTHYSVIHLLEVIADCGATASSSVLTVHRLTI